tara:strand:+ start:352 stop:813 length:462 start_codon:yes stop_codon:yes gene_type:complete
MSEVSKTLEKLSTQQNQHTELVTQIETVTGKNIFTANMTDWWAERCKEIKTCFEEKQRLHTSLKEKMYAEETIEADIDEVVLELAAMIKTFNTCEQQMRRWCRIIGATTDDDVAKMTKSWTTRFRNASNKTNEQYTATFTRWLEVSRRLEAQT